MATREGGGFKGLWAAAETAQAWTRAGGERLSQTCRGLAEEADRFIHDPEVRARVAETADLARKSLGAAANGAAGVVSDRVGQVAGTGAGAAAGICAGIALGAGGVGIVALGGAIGVPLIALTAAAGAFAGERGGREIDLALKQRRSMEQRLAQVHEAENSRAAIRITGDQHRTILDDAIRDAKRFLCIRSGFLSSRVLDASMSEMLANAARREVEITIEYGRLGYLQSTDSLWDRERAREHHTAEQNLKTLFNLLNGEGIQHRLSYGPTWTHIKELAVDDEWLVVGSFNWLSNQKITRGESSLRIRDALMAGHIRHEARKSVGGV